MIITRQLTRSATLMAWLLAASSLAARGDQSAQQPPVSPQQLPVFRAGTVLVRVDAYPRRDGKIVEGLTKDDFQVTEDGKPQAVDGFEFIRIEPNTPDAELRDPTSVADGERQAADPHNRVFVVYLDMFHTTVSGSYYAAQPVINFLTRTIGPTDLFAVMTPRVPVNHLTFARRTETVDNELRKYWDWGERGRLATVPLDATESKLELCGRPGLVTLYREDQTATSLEQLVTRLQNLRDERKNILFMSEGWVPRRGNMPGFGGSGRPNIPTVGIGPTGQLQMGARQGDDIDAHFCDMQATRLAQIDFERRFKDLLTQARRANVAFHTVDVGGLRTGMPSVNEYPANHLAVHQFIQDYQQNSVSRMQILQELAENTDGRAVVNTNDLAGGVKKISDDLSAFYLLGYYSTNSASDGRYRRIEVKVKTPGVKVSARPGYVAPTEEMRKADEAARNKPITAPTAVDAELTRLGRIRSDASVYTMADASASEMKVIVEIASREIESGGWGRGGAVTLTVTPKADGTAPIQAKGAIAENTRSAVIKVPLATVSPAGWRLRVRISGVPGQIEDEIDVMPGAAALVGEPTVFRAGASPRAPLQPMADFQFRRTERVHIEWPAQRTMDNRSARLLNRRGEPLPIEVPVTEKPDGTGFVIAVDVGLAPLAQGDYVIELTASAGSDKIQKLLAFRIVR
jgi:VWFA-related protein